MTEDKNSHAFQQNFKQTVQCKIAKQKAEGFLGFFHSVGYFWRLACVRLFGQGFAVNFCAGAFFRQILARK